MPAARRRLDQNPGVSKPEIPSSRSILVSNPGGLRYPELETSAEWIVGSQILPQHPARCLFSQFRQLTAQHLRRLLDRLGIASCGHTFCSACGKVLLEIDRPEDARVFGPAVGRVVEA